MGEGTEVQGELVQYTTGQAVVPRQDRALVRQAKRLSDEVRLAAFKADGVMALADHIMERALVLDQRRRTLAGENPIVDLMLSEIEATALRKVRVIQDGLFGTW